MQSREYKVVWTNHVHNVTGNVQLNLILLMTNTHPTLPQNKQGCPQLLTQTTLADICTCGSAHDELGAGTQLLEAIWKEHSHQAPVMVATSVTELEAGEPGGSSTTQIP